MNEQEKKAWEEHVEHSHMVIEHWKGREKFSAYGELERARAILAADREMTKMREALEFLSSHSIEIVPQKNGSVELYVDRNDDKDSIWIITPTLLDATEEARRKKEGG